MRIRATTRRDKAVFCAVPDTHYPVLTKTDSGRTRFNLSETAGDTAVAGLSNAYYPPQGRGMHPTLRDWAAQIESAALNNIAKEFWPDIRQKVLRQK